MRQSRVLGFLSLLVTMAWAGWPQLVLAQEVTSTSSPSPFGNCNRTDPKVFDAQKLKNLDAAGKKSLLTSGLPCAEIVSAGSTSIRG
jgi:hypothetical protein